MITLTQAENDAARNDSGIRFDKSINLGNIISFIVLVFTLITFGVKILERMDNMEFKVDAMWQKFDITLRDKR